MFELMRDITVVGRHERRSTTFDILPEGRKTPIARLHKDHFFTSNHALQIFTGDALDELIGWVGTSWSMGLDKVKHGTVKHHPGAVFNQQSWTFEQVGLPVLTGASAGAGMKLRYGTPLAWNPVADSLDAVFSYRIHFRGPGSDGFDFSRLSGVRHPRYAIQIHDERVNPLLALCPVVHYDRWLDGDPRKKVMDFWRVHSLGD